jgi:hypothetical protein
MICMKVIYIYLIVSWRFQLHFSDPEAHPTTCDHWDTAAISKPNQKCGCMRQDNLVALDREVCYRFPHDRC